MKTLIVLVALLLGAARAASAAGSLPQRIVSLAPSTTEILFALGAGDRVIGVTSFCDYPEEAKRREKIGGMSNPSLEAIISLKPDLVVLTTDGNPKEVEERLRSLGIATYVFMARRISELPQGIRDMGAAIGAERAGERLARKIEQALQSFQASGVTRAGDRSASRDPRAASPKKVLFIVWPEPLIVAGPGTAIDDAIKLLGLQNTAARTMTSYPRYSIEEVIREAPEVLFVGKGTGMDMSIVAQGILKKLASVPAMKSGEVCYVSDYLYRLGPRVVSGIEELAACVH